MLNVLTRQLQALKAETYKILSGTSPKVKASKSEIKALHERYSGGLDLLKQIAIQLGERKSLLSKRSRAYSELLEQNNTD